MKKGIILILVCLTITGIMVVAFSRKGNDEMVTSQVPLNGSNSSKVDDEYNTAPMGIPQKDFNHVQEFVNWIKVPKLQADKSDVLNEQESDYFAILHPQIQKMFAVDRFYMLPIVPDDWKLQEINMWPVEVYFRYVDKGGVYHIIQYLLREPNEVDWSYKIMSKIVNNKTYDIFDNRIAWIENGYYVSLREYVVDESNAEFKYTMFDEKSDIETFVSKVNMIKCPIDE